MLKANAQAINRIGMVLRPGFGPGSTTREAVILDRTILPELGLDYFSIALAIYSHFVLFATVHIFISQTK